MPDSLLTSSGLSGAIGVPESTICRALADGTIKHDVTAWRGWSVLALFYPSSVDSIRKALGRNLRPGTPPPLTQQAA